MATTIADIRKGQHWLGILCEACGRSVRIPPKLLPARLVPELPVHLAAAFYRCQGCGSKQLASFADEMSANAPFSEGWRRQG